MKKALSLVLCLIMIASVFTAATVSVSAASPADVMYVNSTGFVNGKVTYNISLRKNISLVGTIVKVVYDPAVLKPVSGGAHSSAANANGIFVADKVKGTSNQYSLAFVSMDTYNVGNADKAFMTVTFECIDKTYPQTSVSFYCVEFNTTDTSKRIEKNDSNPPLISKITSSTLNKISYVGVYSYEKGLRIEWKATPGATGYKVFKYNGSSYVQIGTTKGLTYDDPNVSANSTGKYIVRAYNSYSDYDSAARAAITGYYVKPTDKVAVSIQPASVKVGWYTVAGATSYRVYRRVINSDGSRSGWTFLATVPAGKVNYYDSNALKSGTYYEYTVRAYTANGASAVCRYAALYYYAAPKVTVKAVTGGVQVSWNAVSGAKSYNVYRMYNGDKHWTYIKTVPAGTLSYTDKAVVSGRNVFYTVRTVGQSGASSYQSVKISYVGIPHLTSVANTYSGIQVKWNKVANATGYRVYRRASGEKSWTYLTTTKNVYYNDSNVKNGVYYKYTVRTVFYSMLSDFEAGLLTKCVATPKLTSISNTTAGINVKWGAVGGATEYRVYRRASGETSWTYMGAVKTNQFTDKNVKRGVYYRYTVKAVSGYQSGYNGNGLLIKRS